MDAKVKSPINSKKPQGEPSEAAKELGAQERAQRNRVKQDAELMEQLLVHPAWPRYLSMIEAVSQNFYKTAMAPLENMFAGTKAEYAKGALNGLSLAAQLPHAKINEAKEAYAEAPETDAEA